MPLNTHAVAVVTFYIQTPKGTYTNTTYWQWQGTFDATNLSLMEDVANDVYDQLTALYAKLSTELVLYPGLHLVVYTGDGQEYESFSTHNDVTGDLDDGDGLLPDEVCAIIRRRTNIVGRQHRGRIFIPGISEACQESGEIIPDGLLTPPHRANLRDIAAYLGADQTWAGVTFHARHYNRKDDAIEVVARCIAQKYLGSRRDRTRALHPNLPA